MRLIHKVNDDVKVYRCTEYSEFVVRVNGKPNASYHTDDKQDALDTANIIAASECGALE
jgi:hypothetical protein